MYIGLPQSYWHMPTASPMHDVSNVPCDVIYEECPIYFFAVVYADGEKSVYPSLKKMNQSCWEKNLLYACSGCRSIGTGLGTVNIASHMTHTDIQCHIKTV